MKCFKSISLICIILVISLLACSCGKKSKDIKQNIYSSVTVTYDEALEALKEIQDSSLFLAKEPLNEVWWPKFSEVYYQIMALYEGVKNLSDISVGDQNVADLLNTVLQYKTTYQNFKAASDDNNQENIIYAYSEFSSAINKLNAK